MSSTSINIGISSDSKISSRVLKPPGGGHTDIFAPAEEAAPKPRSKHNQQNSAMMGEIMGKTESNGTKQNGASNDASPSGDDAVCVPAPAAPKPVEVESRKTSEPAARIRVPPGGFSSGLW